MILLHMVDDIAMTFPEINRTRIIFDINNAIMQFCHMTRVMYVRTTLASEDYTAYDDEKGTWTYDLPTDVYEVRSASCCNQEEFEVGDDEITFYFRSNTDDDIVLIYSQRPALLIDDTDVPSIPEIFTPSIIAKVKSKYYGMRGILQNAGWERKIWDEGIAEARRYANTRPLRNVGAGLSGTSGSGSDDGTTIIEAMGHQNLVQGLNIVTIPGTMPNLVYGIMLNGNGVAVVEYNPNSTDPPDTRTTTTFQVLSSEDNNNFEFYIRGRS